MSTDEVGSAGQVPSPTLIRSQRALWLLGTVLVSATAGGQLLADAAARGPAHPPPLSAFIFIFVAIVTLILARPELAVDEPADGRRQEGPGDESGPQPASSLLNLASLPAGRTPWRVLILLGSWAMIAIVLNRLPQKAPQDDYTVVTLGWILAIAFYVVAVAQPRWEHARGWRWPWARLWAKRRGTLLLLSGIMGLAFLLRVPLLDAIPHTLGGDEASQGLEAIRVIEGEIRNPFTTGWLSVPTMSFYFNSLGIRLLGATKSGLRLPWALVGTAAVAAAFFLVKRLRGTGLALGTAALLATYHYHIHFSRLGSNQIADTLLLSLALLFLHRALDRRKMTDWTIAGGVCALAFYFYAGARFAPIVVLALLAYRFVRSPRDFWQEHHLGLLAMAGAFLVVAAPLIQYALRFPDDFNARINQVGIIQSGWLERELAGGRDLVAILFDQFRRAVLAFNFYPDRTVWYGLRQPLLDPFFGVIFLLGLGYGTFAAIAGKEAQRLAPMAIWWWGGVILGGMLTESPPSSQRLVTLAVPTCFFIALGLWQIIHLAQAAFVGVPGRALLAAGVLAFSLISLNTYFVEFTPKRIYGGPHAQLATNLAPLLDELGADHDAYFVGAPQMYWEFATISYLAPRMEGTDILDPITEPPRPGLLPSGRGGVFIFLPARRDELRPVQEAFPEGQMRELRAETAEKQLLAVLYVVGPSR